jgi:hypothetical protein
MQPFASPIFSMETPTHKSLKSAAVRLLLANGCVAAAAEVSCPIARHRVDAAGYLDPLSKKPRRASIAEDSSLTPILTRGERARTIIVECKQSRADFLSDRADALALRERRAHLEAVRAAIEDRILKVCEPELRQTGSSLFPDLERWDFAKSRLASYRSVLRDLAAVDKQLHGSSKFWRLAHYRLADALYIAAPLGMLRPHELPRGWGLLEVSRSAVDAGQWHITSPAPLLEGRAMHRRRLLRNIAVALSKRSAGAETTDARNMPGV